MRINVQLISWFPALAGAILAGATVQAEPVVTRKMDHYEVAGSTPQEVRADLNRRGYLETSSGKRYDAYTTWRLNWNFRYRTEGQRCRITSVATTVDVTIVFPRLQANAPGAVTQAFDAYAEKLLLHENGHAQNGIDVANKIEGALAAMAPEATCDGLAQSANDLARSLVREANAEDIAYDARTQHGRTQGARFP